MFKWDESKRSANLAKHGVDFTEVTEFDWSTSKEQDDARHDFGETRVRALGLIDGRVHVLIYVQRGRAKRVVSLRKANRREINEWLM